jgi:hypothetical protein
MQLRCGPRRQVLVGMRLAALLALGVLFLGGLTGAAAKPSHGLSFDMVVSAGAQNCLPHARAHVTVTSVGQDQQMFVVVDGLPPNTTFTVFVLQVPTAPFAMSWYQGDIDTDKKGRGSHVFFGIFNSETFIHAPAVRDAPQTHPGLDALKNPETLPVHMYHLGLWFDSPDDAQAAGCPNTVTPFNGAHDAGIQVLNTSNFGTEAKDGPLGQLQ